MKKALILFYLLIVTFMSTIAQNDRNILNYTVTERGETSYILSFTITSMGSDGVNMHWSSPLLGEGDILMLPSGRTSGTRSFFEQPLSGSAIRLENDQTVASFSLDFYQQIKKNGRAKYDGIEYISNKKNELIIAGQLANTLFLESVDGDVRAWMLDDPQMPLLVKITGHPSGFDFELDDLGTFFFWEDVYNFKRLSVPESYIPIKPADITQLKNLTLYSKVTDYLPDNYVKDGSKDYTKFIQRCLDSSNYVLMPDFPVMISDVGLDIGSKRTVFFQLNSKLLIKPSNKTHYQMMRVHNAKDVTILNGNLIGDRYIHRGKEGEWGMGISIRGSNNIVVKNTKVSNCWGDGIYIGRLEKLSSNIHIKSCFIDNNRRNGLSVISAKKLKVTNCVFSNTNGTDPQCGVDIEPNNSEDILRDISFENNFTFNNYHSGFLIYLDQSPSSEKSEKVTININNLFDDGSLNPLRISGYSLRDEKTIIPLKGYIKINKLRSKNNKPSVINKNKFFPTIVLKQ